MRKRSMHRTGDSPAPRPVGRRAPWHRFGETSGASLVEMAFVFPMFLFLVMASIQFAIIFMVDYGVKLSADNAVRWLAINPDQTDSTAIADIEATAVPGISGNQFTQITISPACPSLTNGHCTGRDPGDTISITVSYNLLPDFLVPTTFNLGGISVTLPTTLTGYQVSEMVE
jgi:hypothetical protein